MKKKVVAAMMSVALVAAVGIGGTLAYLSSTSNDVKNTFTVGKGFDDTDGQALIVDEWLLDGTADDRTQEDQTYENMTPGYVEKKDPTARLKAGSVESYVFLRVTGVNALENIMKSKPRSNDLIFDLITLCGTTRIPPSVPGGEDGHRNRFVHAEQKNAPLPQSILLCFPSYDGGRIPCSKSTSLIASGMPRKISSISLNFY